MSDGVKERTMNVLIQVWSDNHGHDETFGTRPNKPHYVYDDTVQVESGSNLLAVIAERIRNTLIRNQAEPIYVMWKNSFSGMEEVRVRIANSEYCCRAVVTL